MYVCVQLSHTGVEQRLAQHCESTILQLKFKKAGLCESQKAGANPWTQAETTGETLKATTALSVNPHPIICHHWLLFISSAWKRKGRGEKTKHAYSVQQRATKCQEQKTNIHKCAKH